MNIQVDNDGLPSSLFVHDKINSIHLD
jgi:hypothetical protein